MSYHFLGLTFVFQKLGFFTNLTESFRNFAENYESTFINRRCNMIIGEARALIEAPLTEFVSVYNFLYLD